MVTMGCTELSWPKWRATAWRRKPTAIMARPRNQMALEKAWRISLMLITVSSGAFCTPMRWKMALRALAIPASRAKR